jgi:uncharacterized Fe-S radical SAM superfamily protein PflX
MSCSRRCSLQGALTAAGSLTVPSLAGCDKDRQAPESDQNVASKTEQSSEFQPAYLELEKEGELDRREKKLWAMFKKCQVCPRKCEVNRLAGENDVCRATDQIRVSSAMPHYGEEPPLVGTHGSGTIFFSHCNLRCCFCQNWEIAHRGDGGDIGHQTLAHTMLSLQARGCHGSPSPAGYGCRWCTTPGVTTAWK